MSLIRLEEISSSGEYKEFLGPLTETMPALVADGRKPISIQEIMQKRIEALDASEEVLKYWWGERYPEYIYETNGRVLSNGCFESGDAIAYHPQGKMKIVLDAKIMQGVNPSSPIKEGALLLKYKDYRTLEGVEFSLEDTKKYEPRASADKLFENPIWITVARDKALLREYVEAAIFALRLLEKKYKFMEISLDHGGLGLEGSHVLRPLGLMDLFTYSCLNGHNSFFDIERSYNCRIVGIKQRALEDEI